MRQIDNIVLHCTATPLTTTISSIRNYWRNVLKWRQVGYHIIIRSDGTWERLAEDSAITNGVRGHNAKSIHIATIGGQFIDDRTDGQKNAQLFLLRVFRNKYPDAEIVGHRDFPNVKKECPRYDVRAWLREVGF